MTHVKIELTCASADVTDALLKKEITCCNSAVLSIFLLHTYTLHNSQLGKFCSLSCLVPPSNPVVAIGKEKCRRPLTHKENFVLQRHDKMIYLPCRAYLMSDCQFIMMHVKSLTRSSRFSRIICCLCSLLLLRVCVLTYD